MGKAWHLRLWWRSATTIFNEGTDAAWRPLRRQREGADDTSAARLPRRVEESVRNAYREQVRAESGTVE
jgi:hypothetical protein